MPANFTAEILQEWRLAWGRTIIKELSPFRKSNAGIWIRYVLGILLSGVEDVY